MDTEQYVWLLQIMNEVLGDKITLKEAIRIAEKYRKVVTE